MTGTGVDFYVDGLAGRRKLVQRSSLRMQEFASDCYFRALNTSSHPFLQGNSNVMSGDEMRVL